MTFALNTVLVLAFALVDRLGAQDYMFCDDRYTNNLVDLVFNWKTYFYVYRKPDTFWVLLYNSDNMWQQIHGPLTKNDLFEEWSTDLEFNSILSIWSYRMCISNPSVNCRNDNHYFDPTNITLLFYNDIVFYYRRINERRFVEINNQERRLPWQVTTYGFSKSSKITEVLPNVIPPINISVLIPATATDPEIALFLANTSAFQFYVTDKRESHRDRVIIAKNIQDAVKQGGFFHNSKVYFILSNIVYEYTPERSDTQPTVSMIIKLNKFNQFSLTSGSNSLAILPL